MSAAHIQLMIDLEQSSEPITGSVGAGDAAPRSFRGWSELAALIESHRVSNGAFDAGLTIDAMAPKK
jgi:hypothetical protein